MKAERLWNRKYESLRNEINRENAIQETMQKLAFLQLDVKEVKLKIKTICTRNAAELTKVIKCKKSGADPHDICLSKSFRFRQAHSILRGVCILRTSLSTKDLFLNNIRH